MVTTKHTYSTVELGSQHWEVCPASLQTVRPSSVTMATRPHSDAAAAYQNKKRNITTIVSFMNSTILVCDTNGLKCKVLVYSNGLLWPGSVGLLRENGKKLDKGLRPEHHLLGGFRAVLYLDHFLHLHRHGQEKDDHAEGNELKESVQERVGCIANVHSH